MRREYYLHKRKGGVFYVEFVNPEDGRKLSARSTGETDMAKARARAEFWLLGGVPFGKAKKPRPVQEAAGIEAIVRAIRKSDLTPDDGMRIVSALNGMGLISIVAVGNTGRGAFPFVDFMESFWDYDNSEYIRDKLAHGYRFSRRYAHECRKRLNSELRPFFGDKKLSCVTTADLKKLSGLLFDRGLATSTINQMLLICRTPLKWAFNEKIIPADPTVGLTKFSVVNKERGVLTAEEAAELFAAEWEDKRAFVASLVSATTGVRQGECLALRRSDIGGDTLSIAHSWSSMEGLKCTKNGLSRSAPLLPEVREALLDLLADNPYGGDNPFVFFSLKPDRPVTPNVLLEGLQSALRAVGVDYRGRNISFHSWRHYFCSKITQEIDRGKAAKVSGHLSESVFKKYESHIEAGNVREVGKAAAKVFGNILKFA